MFCKGVNCEIRKQKANKHLFMVTLKKLDNKAQFSSCVMFSDSNASLNIDPKEVSSGTQSNWILLCLLKYSRILKDSKIRDMLGFRCCHLSLWNQACYRQRVRFS